MTPTAGRRRGAGRRRARGPPRRARPARPTAGGGSRRRAAAARPAPRPSLPGSAARSAAVARAASGGEVLQLETVHQPRAVRLVVQQVGEVGQRDPSRAGSVAPDAEHRLLRHHPAGHHHHGLGAEQGHQLGLELRDRAALAVRVPGEVEVHGRRGEPGEVVGRRLAPPGHGALAGVRPPRGSGDRSRRPRQFSARMVLGDAAAAADLLDELLQRGERHPLGHRAVGDPADAELLEPGERHRARGADDGQDVLADRVDQGLDGGLVEPAGDEDQGRAGRDVRLRAADGLRQHLLGVAVPALEERVGAGVEREVRARPRPRRPSGSPRPGPPPRRAASSGPRCWRRRRPPRWPCGSSRPRRRTRPRGRRSPAGRSPARCGRPCRSSRRPGCSPRPRSRASPRSRGWPSRAPACRGCPRPPSR